MHSQKTYRYSEISDASSISWLREKITQIAVDAKADNLAVCDIKLAAGEALSNAWRHGSSSQGRSQIVVNCTTSGSSIQIEIEDEGPPFDPDCAGDVNPAALKENGMGIYIMRQAMDVVSFSTSIKGNKVTMVKWLQA